VLLVLYARNVSTVNCNRTFYNVRYVERIETTLTEEKKATRPNCKLFRKQYDCKYFFLRDVVCWACVKYTQRVCVLRCLYL